MQRPDRAVGLLLHSDVDWEVHEVTPDMLRMDGLREYLEERGHDATSPTIAGLSGTPVVGELILERGEAAWLVACFAATTWSRVYARAQRHECDESENLEMDDRSGLPVLHLGRAVTSEQVAATMRDRLESARIVIQPPVDHG